MRIITFLICLLGFNLSCIAQSADELLRKMDEIIFGPEDKQGIVEIILTNKKSGKQKVREAAFFQKGTDKKLYRYTKPENQAGIATLSLPDDVMWLYMPALGNPKKISLLAKSQAFTGTDFSYEDMATTPYLSRFTPKLASQNELWVLILTPKSKKSHYSKIIVSLDKQHYYPAKMEYFDKGGKKFKECTYRYERSGKYWNASEVVMTNIRKQHETRINLTNIKFDQGLSDELFTVDNLKTKTNKKEN